MVKVGIIGAGRIGEYILPVSQQESLTQRLRQWQILFCQKRQQTGQKAWE